MASSMQFTTYQAIFITIFLSTPLARQAKGEIMYELEKSHALFVSPTSQSIICCAGLLIPLELTTQRFSKVQAMWRKSPLF